MGKTGEAPTPSGTRHEDDEDDAEHPPAPPAPVEPEAAKKRANDLAKQLGTRADAAAKCIESTSQSLRQLKAETAALVAELVSLEKAGGTQREVSSKNSWRAKKLLYITKPRRRFVEELDDDTRTWPSLAGVRLPKLKKSEIPILPFSLTCSSEPAAEVEAARRQGETQREISEIHRMQASLHQAMETTANLGALLDEGCTELHRMRQDGAELGDPDFLPPGTVLPQPEKPSSSKPLLLIQRIRDLEDQAIACAQRNQHLVQEVRKISQRGFRAALTPSDKWKMQTSPRGLDRVRRYQLAGT